MVGTWGTCYCCLEFVYLSGPALLISTEQDHEWASMCLLATAPSEFGAQMYSEHAQGLKGAPPDSLFSRFCLHALQFGTCNIRGTKKYHHNFLALLLPMLHPSRYPSVYQTHVMRRPSWHFYDCTAIAVLWIEFVREVRWCWDEGLRLPRVYVNGSPDLETCLLHQKLQLVMSNFIWLQQYNILSELGSADLVSLYSWVVQLSC